jgi:hypothetical protein
MLGCGSMAEVYQAEDLQLCRDVAIKLFQPDPGPLTWQRFGEEARVLAQLSHPGLVSIYDAGMDESRPFLVMLLVPGGSLSHQLRTGPFPRARVLRIGIALAEALDHVHGRGIVHRDIKPSNILLGNSGEPYLADFGIAHLAGAVRLTKSGEVVGTAAYLAPEQLTGGALTPAIDVYGLGLVLLECLTGELAFPGGSQVESALARLHRRPHIPEAVPSRLAALLEAMTDPDPAQRPSACQCAAVLRALDTSSTATASPAAVCPADRVAMTPAPRRVPLPLLTTAPGTFQVTRPGGMPLAAAAIARAAPPAEPGHPCRTPFGRSPKRAFAAAAGLAIAFAAGLALLLGALGAATRQPPSQGIPAGPRVPATSATSAHTAVPAPSAVAAVTTSHAVAPPPAGPPVSHAPHPKPAPPGKAKGHGGGKGHSGAKAGK